MADNGPNIPGAPDQHAASVPVPSDNEFPYTYTPSIAYPNAGGRLPGHKQADPLAIQAAVSKRYQAEVAASVAKSDAQLRADTLFSQPQHPTIRATYTPAPRRRGR